MTCQHRDPELLLLYHAELSLWRRLCTQAHLAYCARCQKRLDGLIRTSRLLAHTLPCLSLPLRTGTERPVRYHRQTTMIWPVFTLLVLLAFLTAMAAVTLSRPAHCAVGGIDSGCLPRLSSDRCR